MRKHTLIGVGLAAALVAGVGAYSYTASAQNGGYGPGMMGGYGPGYGHMGGWGGGPGAGPGNCPGFGPYNQSKTGQGSSKGQDYGPAYHMRGWGGGYGPGMMQGYGPGMMQGYGPGGNVQGNKTNQTLNLSIDDVKGRMERWLVRRDNPRLKVGEVKEKDADTIIADIVTKDNSLVQRFIVDRHSGYVRQDNG